MKALKKDATYADLSGVPDNFVAEILGGELYASPRPAYPHAFAASALGMKIGGPGPFLYARESVRHAWLVDPLQQTLEVFGLESARWTLLATHEADERVRAEPFEAIDLDLGALWPD